MWYVVYFSNEKNPREFDDNTFFCYEIRVCVMIKWKKKVGLWNGKESHDIWCLVGTFNFLKNVVRNIVQISMNILKIWFAFPFTVAYLFIYFFFCSFFFHFKYVRNNMLRAQPLFIIYIHTELTDCWISS